VDEPGLLAFDERDELGGGVHAQLLLVTSSLRHQADGITSVRSGQ